MEEEIKESFASHGEKTADGFLWDGIEVSRIQDLETMIIRMASSLSKRGRDVFRALYGQCGEDVATLAYTLVMPDFSWGSCRHGIGEKTIDELEAFSSDVLSLVSGYRNVPGLEEYGCYEKKALLIRNGFSRNNAEELTRREADLGYFPVAAFMLAWFSSLDERNTYICRHGFDIWKEDKTASLAAMAGHLGITGERCRQIRCHLLDKIVSVTGGLALKGPCPYDCLDGNLDALVNEAEGTSFTINFLRFILGESYSELSVVGAWENSIIAKERGGEANPFIAAVPARLAESFDFDSFLAATESLNIEKRRDVSYMPLPDCYPEVKTLAASLAELRYGWVSENGSLVIPPNADKNRSDIMEDIIRDAGHPLTMDEIASEYKRRHPDKIIDRSRIRGNMQVNPRIVPIGRTGVYSLSEWTTGSERGGTIRSFVKECLDNSGTHIVPVREVGEYVRRFRPTSSDENIVSNLLLESKKSLRVIWKDGIQYLSYSSESIPEGFKQITRTFTVRRSSKESLSLLDEFITKYGRMPKACGDPDESRLAGFLTNWRSLRRRGKLDRDELDELSRIESRLEEPVLF